MKRAVVGSLTTLSAVEALSLTHQAKKNRRTQKALSTEVTTEVTPLSSTLSTEVTLASKITTYHELTFAREDKFKDMEEKHLLFAAKQHQDAPAALLQKSFNSVVDNAKAYNNELLQGVVSKKFDASLKTDSVKNIQEFYTSVDRVTTSMVDLRLMIEAEEEHVLDLWKDVEQKRKLYKKLEVLREDGMSKAKTIEEEVKVLQTVNKAPLAGPQYRIRCVHYSSVEPNTSMIQDCHELDEVDVEVNDSLVSGP